MIIQEAMKSGKPFKRKEDKETEWLIVGNRGMFQWLTTGHEIIIGTNDILADDWEIKS